MLSQDSTPPYEPPASPPGFLSEYELDARYPPLPDSGIPRGLRDDLDQPSRCNTLSGLARPIPSVAPAAGDWTGKTCAAGYASGTLVKGSGDPHSSGNGVVKPTGSLWLVYVPYPAARKPTPFAGFYGELEIAVGGTFTRLSCRGGKGKPPDTARRGRIAGFSVRSRQRMMDMFNSLNMKLLPKHPKFITLTYPGCWDQDPVTWKRHLDAFVKRLERAYGVVPIPWKLEFQERGAPHFHLMWLGNEFVPHQWVAQNWHEIVAPDDSYHRKSGTQIKRIKNRRQMMYYASKYMAKVAGSVTLRLGTGRLWGVRRASLLPRTVVSYTMSHGVFLKMRAAINGRRAVLGLSASVRSKFQGVRLYHSEKEARKLLKFLREDRPMARRVYGAPLFESDGTGTDEWQKWMLPWWENKHHPPRSLAEIVASIPDRDVLIPPRSASDTGPPGQTVVLICCAQCRRPVGTAVRQPETAVICATCDKGI